MKKAALLFLFSWNFFRIFAQTEFSQPWLDSTRAIILDPYCKNPIDWEKLITDKQVVGMIHKASQGDSIDCEYANRKALARKYGLLWGSYHMGMKGDPIRQAEHYLKLVNNDSSELLALDLESMDSSKFMSLYNAEKFIRHIHQSTGRYPLLYCNNAVLDGISKKYSDTSIFSKCGLWYARFVREMPAFNTNVWKKYTVWQFSCEINCKKTGECNYNAPGTLYDMDVNVFNGNIAKLRSNWPNIKVEPEPVLENHRWLNSFDLDGDAVADHISFEFTGGAHCCYLLHVTLSSDKKEHSFPFNMDGGYVFGVDNSQPDKFNILNVDEDPLPEIRMSIETYNGEENPLPFEYKLKYGIRTNHILVQFENGKLTVSDQKK